MILSRVLVSCISRMDCYGSKGVISEMWKVVIVDDDRHVLAGMKQSIPWEDLNAEWAGDATNGADGLELIQSVQPDVIITDIYMPIMDGLEMIEQLRESDFAGKVIILSGYSDFEYARKSLRLNVHDYLSKPVSLPTLHAVLSKALAELGEELARKVRQDELEQKLMRYEPYYQKEWVKSALTGMLDREDMQLPVIFRHWEACCHLVFAVELIRESRANTENISDWNLFRFAVQNIITEMVQDKVPSFEFIDLHSTRSAVMLHLDPSRATTFVKEVARDLALNISESIKQYLKLSVRIGIGSLKTDWRDIPDSTEEAFRAIDHQKQSMSEGIEVYTKQGSFDDSTPFIKHRPIKFCQELVSMIKLTQEAQAHVVIDEYVELLKEEDCNSPEDIKMLAGELWGIFAYCLYEVGLLLDDLFPNVEISEELARLSNLDEFSNWLKDKVTVICNNYMWHGNNRHRQAVDFMIQYIHEHYAEEITLGDLANKVYISRNYLSSIFRSITGETFNNYLTRVRIEKAKELLMQPNMLVYEVAEKVGYKNVPYFSTLFKKYTGMNPTDYIR